MIHIPIPHIVPRPQYRFNTVLISTVRNFITSYGVTQSYVVPVHKRCYLLHYTSIGLQHKHKS